MRELAERCHVVAEQFVLGYALAAMEGMALGKPVLSNLTVIHRMIYTYQECKRLEDAQLRAVPERVEEAEEQRGA